MHTKNHYEQHCMENYLIIYSVMVETLISFSHGLFQRIFFVFFFNIYVKKTANSICALLISIKTVNKYGAYLKNEKKNLYYVRLKKIDLSLYYSFSLIFNDLIDIYVFFYTRFFFL